MPPAPSGGEPQGLAPRLRAESRRLAQLRRLADHEQRAGLLAAGRDASIRLLRGGLDFSGRVWRKSGDDDIFFLAGGVAFNVLLGAIPLFVLVVAIFAQLMQAYRPDPEGDVVSLLFYVLPESPALNRFVRAQVTRLIEASSDALSPAALLVIWAATRMIGCLRSTLREVFDIPDDRGIVGGKIFDIKMVIVVGILFLIGTGTTVFLNVVESFGTRLFGTFGQVELRALELVYSQLLAFATSFVMYVLMYRYLPARRIPWRTSLVAATFTATVWELLKTGFVSYIKYGGSYENAYGPFATAIVVVFWIYWSAVVFILGGEVGVVYQLYRTRSRQRELLD